MLRGGPGYGWEDILEVGFVWTLELQLSHLPLPAVLLGHSLTLSVPQCPRLYNVIITAPSSKGYGEN